MRCTIFHKFTIFFLIINLFMFIKTNKQLDTNPCTNKDIDEPPSWSLADLIVKIENIEGKCQKCLNGSCQQCDLFYLNNSDSERMTKLTKRFRILENLNQLNKNNGNHLTKKFPLNEGAFFNDFNGKINCSNEWVPLFGEKMKCELKDGGKVDIKFNQTAMHKCMCPKCPPYLVGKWSINKTTPNSMEEVAQKYPNVQNGGSWYPENCHQKRMRIAIVIPYRNRNAHLMALLNNLHPFLQRQQANYRIFVANQAYPNDGTMDKFNRAKILNSAFDVIREKIWGKEDTCFIFHDVDLVPDYDKNIYRCDPHGPIRLFATADEWNYWENPKVIGAICAQTGEQFIKANGFSNIYWGWGSEDEDLLYRYKMSEQDVEFVGRPIGDYSSLELINKPDDPTNPKIENNCHKILKEWRMTNWRTDGLNDMDYKHIETEEHPLYTNISIDLLMTKSLQLKGHPCKDNSHQTGKSFLFTNILCFSYHLSFQILNHYYWNWI